VTENNFATFIEKTSRCYHYASFAKPKCKPNKMPLFSIYFIEFFNLLNYN